MHKSNCTMSGFIDQALKLSIYFPILLHFSPEAVERRASLAISAHPTQLPPLLLPLEDVSPHRRVEEAFHCKLKGQVVVDKKTLVELQNFQSVRRDYRPNPGNSTTAVVRRSAVVLLCRALAGSGGEGVSWKGKLIPEAPLRPGCCEYSMTLL